MKFFQKVLEIRNKKGELHFQRFAIFEFKKFALYIHKIHKEDKDAHCHSHPWNYISLVLKGQYVEVANSMYLENHQMHDYIGRIPFSLAKSDRNRFHKIYKIVFGPVYTLFLTYGEKRPWYYLTKSGKIESEEYRKLKNEGKLPI